jgi:hypothetical protein
LLVLSAPLRLRVNAAAADTLAMDSWARPSRTSRGTGTRVLPVLLALVAVAMPEARRESPRTRPVNYIFETHYDLRSGGSAAFDRFWAALRNTPAHVLTIARHVDAVDDAGHVRRVVTLPVEHLAEYGADRRNEDVVRSTMGEDAARAVIGEFNEAQLSRMSYLRQYRTDLSVNREQYHRGAADAVSFVTVVEGGEPAFERVWRRAAEAYRAIAPAQVMTVARTLVGGGPQFVIARPIEAGTATAVLQPAEAVRQAFGNEAAREFDNDLRAVVASWRTATHTNLGLDTPGFMRQEAHR